MEKVTLKSNQRWNRRNLRLSPLSLTAILSNRKQWLIKSHCVKIAHISQNKDMTREEQELRETRPKMLEIYERLTVSRVPGV